MKKGRIAFLFAILLALGLSACGQSDKVEATDSPAVASGEVTQAPSTASQEIDSAHTAEELRALIKTYQASGDLDSAYLAAKKLIALVPSDTQAYQDAITALLGTISGDYQEIENLISLGIQNAPDEANSFVQWANEQNQTFSYTIPFFADYASESEINVVGTTAGSLVNQDVLGSDLWLNGLMTTQGSWVYFALPSDDCSIYKMRTDGSGIKKIGDARGDNVNVVGDWLYYKNLSDEGKPYRIRTDGTLKEGPLFNNAGMMSVTKDWIYYEDGALYKTRPDTGETVQFIDGMNALMTVYDGWIYYCTGGNNSAFCRIPVEGGEPQKLIDGWMIRYAMQDGWIYYLVNREDKSVYRMRPDGSEQSEVYRSESMLSAFAVVKNQLVVSVCTEVDDRGKPVPTELRVLDLASGLILQTRKASTSSIYVAADSVCYTENGVWQSWNLSTGSAGTIQFSPSTAEVSIVEKSALTLQDLGFEYVQDVGLYVFEDQQEKLKIEVSRPDIGASTEEYNLLLLREINGYLVGIWYYEEENLLVIQADKGETSAKYSYDLTSKTFFDEWASTGSVEQQFVAAFGKQDGDFHITALRMFTDTIQERFGISWQKFYALPVI